jgi:hypothetical protein
VEEDKGSTLLTHKTMFRNFENSFRESLQFLLDILKKGLKSVMEHPGKYKIFQLEDDKFKFVNPDIIGETLDFYSRKLVYPFPGKKEEDLERDSVYREDWKTSRRIRKKVGRGGSKKTALGVCSKKVRNKISKEIVGLKLRMET